MNRMLIYCAFFCLIFFFSFCGPSRKWTVATIPDYRDIDPPGQDIAKHKPRDVEIYRSLFMGEGYKAVIYNDLTGTLVPHECWYGSDEIFEQVRYYWKNDSTVCFALYNKGKRPGISFELFGKGSITGVSTKN
jgi:hypothetical protein